MSEVKVKITTNIPVILVQGFADAVKRKRSQIDKAVSDGFLDYGYVFGIKVIILNQKAESYSSLCESLDEVSEQKSKRKKSTK